MPKENFTIDKVKPWGIGNDLPEGMTEIKSIRLQQPGRGSVFVREAIKNMFPAYNGFQQCGSNFPGQRQYFLYMINGSGENRYTTLWTIKKEE
jgi:hypothetical protein